MLRRLFVPLLLLASPALLCGETVPRAAAFGPPWISIELPPSPFDASTRNAFLLVHAYHHGTPSNFPVSGTAEGLVDGKRRSVPLEFKETSRTGIFALAKQWSDDGEWTLVITVEQGKDDVAQAIVEVSNGTVVAVRVPTREDRMANGWSWPRRATPQEIEASLATRTAKSKLARN